jgi:hypothetical protein
MSLAIMFCEHCTNLIKFNDTFDKVLFMLVDVLDFDFENW